MIALRHNRRCKATLRAVFRYSIRAGDNGIDFALSRLLSGLES